MSALFTMNMDSPLGVLHLLASEHGLCGAWFEHQKHCPDPAEQARWSLAPAHPCLTQSRTEIGEYFAGQRQVFDVPLDLSRGTAFQQRVWQALLEVDCGRTLTYGDLARRIQNPQAVRAVGAAVGRNPVSIIVPCHRILGSSGQLTGYAGGLWRKQALLQLEGLALC